MSLDGIMGLVPPPLQKTASDSKTLYEDEFMREFREKYPDYPVPKKTKQKTAPTGSTGTR